MEKPIMARKLKPSLRNKTWPWQMCLPLKEFRLHHRLAPPVPSPPPVAEQPL